MRVLIVIRCPKTGLEVPTGTVTTLDQLHTLPKEKMPLRCPACGEEHHWSANDALLAYSGEGLDKPLAKREGED